MNYNELWRDSEFNYFLYTFDTSVNTVDFSYHMKVSLIPLPSNSIVEFNPDKSLKSIKSNAQNKN